MVPKWKRMTAFTNNRLTYNKSLIGTGGELEGEG